MNKQFELYQQVVLSKDIIEEQMQKGDVATIIEIIETHSNKGFCLEFFDNNGKTAKVIIVDESAISAIKPHSIVNYRELETQ